MSSRRRKTKLRPDTKKEASVRTAQGANRTGTSFAGREDAHRRPEQVYEISKVFTSFENVEQTSDTARGIAAVRAKQEESGRADRRLQHLYEISKLLTRFETVEQTIHAALGIVSETLPLRSAILILETEGRPRMVVW